MKSRTQTHFEKIFLPHLDAAYNLARWISRDPTLAEDIVQAAYVRAWEYFERYENRNSSAWLLTIVRNVAYTMLAKRNKENNLVSFDELIHHGLDSSPKTSDGVPGLMGNSRSSPEFIVQQLSDGEHINLAMQSLSNELREVILLREVDGYSYKEISEITEVPIGTVMSRLSRARCQLARRLNAVLDRDSEDHGSERRGSK